MISVKPLRIAILFVCSFAEILSQLRSRSVILNEVKNLDRLLAYKAKSFGFASG